VYVVKEFRTAGGLI